MKFIFDPKEELEIKGIFDSNKQEIEFNNCDENHVIITGKNGSGKTQLISMILEQLNGKKIVGHLTYNLAFNFNETRMGNVKEIEDNGKILEFFEKIKEENKNTDIGSDDLFIYFKEKLLDSIGIEPFKYFKPFNYFIYFNKVFNYLKEKYNYNLESPIDEMKKDLKDFGILENSLKFEEANGILKIELDTCPTSGEVLFLNLLVLKWIHNKVKKFDFLLFDEPDRHFESKVTEKFLKFLKDQFKEVFIFMTTHRPDSIVLSQSDNFNFTLCRLKKRAPGDHYLEKIDTKANKACNWFFVMSTIFDLTYNLRDLMNIKIRVYVESNDDYKFYKGFYHLLLDYCNDLRTLPKEKKNVYQKQAFFKEFPILSRRYQLYFCTSALKSNGGDGGTGMVEKNCNRDLIQQELDFNNFKSLWDGDFFNSYAILDRDGDLLSNNGHKIDKYGRNFHFLKRYCFENYIIDPMFLFSMKINNNNNNNNNNDEINFFKNTSIVKDLDKGSDGNISTSNENINKYFKFLIKKLLDSKNIFVRNYIEKQKLVIEKIIIILKNNEGIKEKKKILNDYLDNQSTNNDQLIDYLMIDARPEKYFKFNYANKGKLLDPYFETKELNYPSILLDLNGKDLVKIVNTMMNGKYVTNLIKSISNNKERLWISKDLVEIFSNINSRIRGYPIYYLIEKGIDPKREKEEKEKKIEKDKAWKIIEKAGFSEKKFNFNLKICEDLKMWTIKNEQIILNSSK